MEKTNQTRRFIALILKIVLLIALPLFFEIYYITLYFIGFIILIPIAIYRIIKDEKFDKRFLNRWHKAREKGFWGNVFYSGFHVFFEMIVVICLTQLFWNGRTPSFIVYALPNKVMIGSLLFLIMLSFLAGIAAWFENEKRYVRLKSKECVEEI